MDDGGLDAALTRVAVEPREIDENELKRARRLLSTADAAASGTDLKAEDLDTPAVRRLFARELVRFHDTRPPSYAVPLQVLRLGDAFLCGIPGEPFVEIGITLKNTPGGAAVIPVALANGYFGYIPTESSFGNGGYEVRAGRHNCLSRKAEGIIVGELRKMLRDLTVGRNCG
jgi:hypothetical protein